MGVYKNLHFPTPKDKSYFFSNFVATIDGRSVIKHTDTYNPIGSDTDFETFIDLRTYADALIHGKHTAAAHRTVKTIAQKSFLEKRKSKKKSAILPYLIVTNTPDDSLLPALINNPMEKPYIVTNEKAKIEKNIASLATIIRIGNKKVDLHKLAVYLFSHGYKHVLIEGGPTLMGSFISENLVDEVFLTIAPKILSGRQNEFITMNEGTLIPPKKMPTWKLLSVKEKNNELFLRYKRDAEINSA